MAIATPPTGVSNAELIRWSFDQLNNHDVGPVKHGLWTAGTVVRFPDRTCHGADEIAAYFEDVIPATDGFHLEIVSLAEQGDDVFVRWHLTGTHTGRVFGLEPTGKPLEIDGMDHFTLRDGHVVSNFVVYDQMQFSRQIGLLPPDGSAADRGLKAAFNAKTRVAKEIQARRSTS
jgi:predicted ester cyclase